MYKVKVFYKNYLGREREADVLFNLDTREVFKLLPELKSTFDWIESHQPEPGQEKVAARNLSTEEVKEFYDYLENIVLQAWGEMSDDGEYFHKTGRYEFEESKKFNACMELFVMDPQQAVKLLESLLPQELFDKVKNANPDEIERISQSRMEEMQKEMDRMREQIKTQGHTEPLNP